MSLLLRKKMQTRDFFSGSAFDFFSRAPVFNTFSTISGIWLRAPLLIYNIFVMFTIIIINRFKRLRSFYSELVALTSFLIEVENLQTQVFWELCFLFFFPCPGFQYFSCDRFNMGSAFDLFFPRPQFSILFSAISGIWLRAPIVDLYLCYVYFFGFSSFLSWLFFFFRQITMMSLGIPALSTMKGPNSKT